MREDIHIAGADNEQAPRCDTVTATGLEQCSRAKWGNVALYGGVGCAGAIFGSVLVASAAAWLRPGSPLGLLLAATALGALLTALAVGALLDHDEGCPRRRQ